MIRTIIVYAVVFAALYLIGISTHLAILETKETSLQFPLKNVYLFHAVSSGLICSLFKIFSRVEKVFRQLGFIYLIAVAVKMAIFFIIFYKSTLGHENLTQESKISLLIPVFLFLLFEVIFVARILNQKGAEI